MPLPPHIQWLATHRGHELVVPLASQDSRLDIQAALGVLADADPSPGLHGVQWLFDTLVAGGVRWEDVRAGQGSRAHETLVLFAQHRRGLSNEDRKLEKYNSLGAIWNALAPLLDKAQGGIELEPRGREARRAARAAAREQSTIVCNRADLIVAVPHTMGAAQWWGRGTRWCTSAEGDNMFEHYNRSAPLVVIMLRDGARHSETIGGIKLQLHADGDQLQFMDASDDEVTSEFVGQHWDQLSGVLTWAGRRGADLGQLVPPHLWKDEVGELVMAHDGTRLELVPQEWITPAMCAAAVANKPDALAMVPMALRDAAVYRAAVDANGTALGWIAHSARLPGLCMLAVQSSGKALSSVPRHLRTPAIMMAAVCQDGRALAIVGEDKRSLDICTAAVHQNGRAIEYVPRNLWSPELCMAAVSRHGDALGCIGGQWWTPELLMAAVRQDGHAIRHLTHTRVAETTQWPGLCLAAVQQNPTSMDYLPTHQRTPEICRAAVLADGWALGYVPHELQDAGLCALAVANKPCALRWVLPQYVTHKLVMSAVLVDGTCLRYVTSMHFDDEIYLAALRKDPWTIRNIHSPAQTPELCAIAIEGDPSTLVYMDETVMTHDLCVQAVQADPSLVRYVREDLREGVLAAVQAVPGRPTPVLETQWDRAVLDGLQECLQDRKVEADNALEVPAPAGARR